MGIGAYRDVGLNTLPRELWPSAAYAGVLSLIGRADRAIGRGDVQDANNTLIRAQQIVFTLRASVPPESGDLGGNLTALYDYIVAQLGQANISKDRGRLRALIDVIAPLRDAWQAAGRNALVGAGGPAGEEG